MTISHLFLHCRVWTEICYKRLLEENNLLYQLEMTERELNIQIFTLTRENKMTGQDIKLGSCSASNISRALMLHIQLNKVQTTPLLYF